ncbi:hypothetical protein JOQ06_011062, partial [Pogonophryne albipinna]
RGEDALNPSHLPPEEAGESGTRRAHGGRQGRGRHTALESECPEVPGRHSYPSHQFMFLTQQMSHKMTRNRASRGEDALNPSHLPPEEAGESGTRRAHGGRQGRGRHTALESECPEVPGRHSYPSHQFMFLTQQMSHKMTRNRAS